MEYRYFLTYGIERYEVEEPAGIGEVESVLSRDFEAHGITYEFTASDITAKFHCEGRRILRGAYEAEGVDAQVIFEIEFREHYIDQWQLHTSAPLRADFSTYQVDNVYVEISFYRDDIVSKLRTRNDVTTNISNITSIDGVPLEEMPVSEALFHSKTIQKAASYTYNTEFASSDLGWNGTLGNVHLIPAFTTKINEVEGATQASTPKIVGDAQLAQYGNIFYSGKLGATTRSITVTGQLVFSLQNTLDTNTYPVEVNVYRYSIASRELVDVGGTGGGLYNDVIKRFELPFYATVNLGSDENLAVSITFPSDANNNPRRFKINVDLEQSSMMLTENTTVQAEGEEQGANLKCYKLFDAVQRNLEIITDKKGVLKSHFLFQGGGADNVVLNGYMLRQFADRPPEFTFKQAMQAVQALWNLGYGVEGLGDAQQVVIEHMDYFYRDAEIIRIDNPANYKERTAEEYMFNQLQVGFEKYAQDENQTNTIDDVHTKHEYLLPIKAVKAKKDIICPWVLSAYLIEVTKRKAYEETPTESFRYDNDIFLIHSKQVGEETDIGGAILAAEKDEAFEHISGILSPETMYNLRYTPKRMMLNWGKYLNSFMYYHAREALVRNQQALLNGLAETQFRTSEPNKLGDEQGFKRIEGAHEKLENIYSMKRTFRPEIVTWTATMCKEDIDLIVNAHQGALEGVDSARNYGYVLVENYDGQYVPVYLLEMRWNYLERVVRFEGIKQATDPEPAPNMPGLLQETLGYNFITTEGGIVIALE